MVNNLPKATGLEHSRARIQTWNLEPAWLQENAVTALNKLRASWREIKCTQMCLQPKWLCRKSRGQECSGREKTWLSGSKRLLRRVGWELGLKKWGHIILLGKKSKDILGRRNKSEQEMRQILGTFGEQSYCALVKKCGRGHGDLTPQKPRETVRVLTSW